jgi:sulfane dehydrogenase subunit SoxC
MTSRGDHVSRRRFLRAATTGIAGSTVAGSVLADTLADVPPREPGAPLSGHSQRSQYVKLSRIPEAGPGLRHVDPNDAINSKTPLNKLVGSITPTDLHYERSHAGVPDLDPAKHRLLIHGMVRRPLVLTVNDLMAMPSVSRLHFTQGSGTVAHGKQVYQDNCEVCHGKENWIGEWVARFGSPLIDKCWVKG